MSRRNKRNNKGKSNKRGSQRTGTLSLYKQLVETSVLEVGFYHNLLDYQNDARDLFTQMNSGSNDYSQYRDIYTHFKMIQVSFTVVPAFAIPVALSDNAMGLFGMRQGIFESSPISQSVSTLAQYPGTRPLHNFKGRVYSYPIISSEWFSNTETNTAVSDVPKFTYYTAWYKVATTNTAQAIVQVKVKLVAKGKLI